MFLIIIGQWSILISIFLTSILSDSSSSKKEDKKYFKGFNMLKETSRTNQRFPGLFPFSEFTEPGSSQQSAVSALLLSTCKNTCAHPSLGSSLCSAGCENGLFIFPLISFRAQPLPLQACADLSLGCH